MKTITVNGWIAVTKAGRPSRRRLVTWDGVKTSAPKVWIARRPKGEPYVKRVRVTIEEIPATAKEGAC
jgi:hypothetical protein